MSPRVHLKRPAKPFMLVPVALLLVVLTCSPGTLSLFGGAVAVAEGEQGTREADNPLSRLLSEYGTATNGENGYLESLYLAEGCTAEGMETWLVFQNPLDDGPAVLDIDFLTATGRVEGPRGLEVPVLSRRTLLVNTYLPGCYDLSIEVKCKENVVLCERSMYGPGRAWGHCNTASWGPFEVWLFPEGCTAGGMETWLAIQNPDDEEKAVLDIDFLTATGRVEGPRDVEVPALSRRTLRLNDYLPGCYDLSVAVYCNEGVVVCERSMYGPNKTWGHCSSLNMYMMVADAPDEVYPYWLFPEGCTAGGMETWLAIQNPDDEEKAVVDIDFLTATGRVEGPRGLEVPALSRRTLRLNDYLPGCYDLSVVVYRKEGWVACERSMYGPGGLWAHCGQGTPTLWWASQNGDDLSGVFAEGCTAAGMETWLVLQNPLEEKAVVDIDFLTATGRVEGPRGVEVPALSRRTLRLNDYLPGCYDLSVAVYRKEGLAVSERSMYGPGRAWGHNTSGIQLFGI